MAALKVVFLTGSHPRHLYLAKTLADAGFLEGLLVEGRAQFIPEPPVGLNKTDHDNFIRHFRDRAEAEERTFGRINKGYFKDTKMINVSRSELNSERVLLWVKDLKPDIVISYGVHIIKDELLAGFPEYSWNIHGGLSPWYRGCITLFWPFYFLQPNWAGMTIHYLSNKLDAGDIVHHSVPELKAGDGVHDVATRAVAQVAEDLIKILEMVEVGKEIPRVKQGSNGKLFLARDWKPEHLRLVYNTFNNDIVDRYLLGELKPAEPKLVRALRL